MSLIYHITSKAEWEKAKKQGFYSHPSLEAEGFIHCSEEHQVAGVLERYYKGSKDLVKLVIQPENLAAPLKYERAPSVNEDFPHIFGYINLDAILEVKPVN